MDERRLSTGDLLASGILNKAAPETDAPKDREEYDATKEDAMSHDAVAAALESGKLVTAANYYGIPYAWKQADGIYRGCLLQYRIVTESPTFATVAEAVKWFVEKFYATDG